MTNVHDRWMRNFMRRARRPSRNWLVALDGSTAVLTLRRATPVFRFRALKAATRERLLAARNDTEVYAALGPDARKLLLDGMRRLIEDGGGIAGARRALARRGTH
jgi:hypothetical protein